MLYYVRVINFRIIIIICKVVTSPVLFIRMSQRGEKILCVNNGSILMCIVHCAAVVLLALHLVYLYVG